MALVENKTVSIAEKKDKVTGELKKIDPFNLDGMKTTDLVDLLKVRHPVYDKKLAERQLQREVRDSEPTDSRLIKGTLESKEEFELRGKLAEFTPETPLVVQRICGFLCQSDSDRGSMNDNLDRFIENADGRGTSFQDAKKSIIEDSLYLDAAFALVNRNPHPDGIDNPTAADVGDPFMEYCSAFEVVNWWYTNVLKWVCVRKEYQTQETPFQKREQRILYRIFTQNEWYRIEYRPKPNEDKNESILIATEDESKINIDIESDEHNIGLVPLVGFIPFEDGAMSGDSFVKSAARLDMAAFRTDSDYRFDMYLHAHPKMVIEGSADAVKNFNSSSVINLNPNQSEKASYLSPSSEIFEVLRTSISDDRRKIWEHTYQDAASRINADVRMGDESGVHKRLSFEMAEGAILNHLVTKEIEFEIKVFELVARWHDGRADIPADEKVFRGEVTKNKNFDSFWIAEYIKTIVDAFPWIQYSPTLMRQIIKRISRAVLDDPNQELINTIEEEVTKSQSLISDAVDSLVDRYQQLNNSGIPSDTLKRELAKQVAAYVIDDSEDYESVLKTISGELDAANFDELNNSMFGGRLESEIEDDATLNARQKETKKALPAV